jgi:hypothetical protein
LASSRSSSPGAGMWPAPNGLPASFREQVQREAVRL